MPENGSAENIFIWKGREIWMEYWDLYTKYRERRFLTRRFWGTLLFRSSFSMGNCIGRKGREIR